MFYSNDFRARPGRFNRRFLASSSLYLSLVFIAGLGAACAGFQTSDDFAESERRAEQGKATEEAKAIRENLDDIPEKHYARTVETLKKNKSPEAGKLLKELIEDSRFKKEKQKILHALIERDEKGAPEFVARKVGADERLFSKKAASYLIKKDPPGSPELIKERVDKDKSNLTPEAEEYLIRKDPPGTPVTFRQIAEEDEGRVTEPMVEYFGQKKYQPAIPVIKSILDHGKFIVTAIKALKNMGDIKLRNYFFSIAEKKGHPARLPMLKELAQEKDEGVRQETTRTMGKIVKDYKTEEEKAVLISLDSLPNLPYSDEVYEELKTVYRDSPNREYRLRALNAMSKMKKVDPYLLARDIQVSLIDYQAKFAGIQPEPPRAIEEKKPVVLPEDKEEVEEVKPEPRIKKKERRIVRRRNVRTRPANLRPGRYPRTSAAYRSTLMGHLQSNMGEREATALFRRINNALKHYSDSSNTASRRFVLRSYKKEFGGDDQNSARLLGRGLYHPGSLHAILKNILREYKSAPMRRYALSELLSIPRWQALILLEYVSGTEKKK